MSLHSEEEEEEEKEEEEDLFVFNDTIEGPRVFCYTVFHVI